MVIVVEGKNDKNKILSIFKDANVLTTNGSEISKATLDGIETLSLNNDIVLCLDPDGPGEKIRKKIMERVPNCANVYAKKSIAISRNRKKVGIEHMSKEDILSLFENVYKPTYKGKITYGELYDLNLMDNKKKRKALCEKLNIGYCNGKQLLKRLNMLDISIQKVKENCDDC